MQINARYLRCLVPIGWYENQHLGTWRRWLWEATHGAQWSHEIAADYEREIPTRLWWDRQRIYWM